MDFGSDTPNTSPVTRNEDANGKFLSDMDLDGLLQPGNVNVSSKLETKESKKHVGSTKPTLTLDDDFLEKAAENASYSTEHRSALGRIKEVERGEETFIVINGKELKVRSERVPPEDTVVWAGNPRLFEKGGADIEDLLPLIHHTKGNTIPAYGRYVSDGQGSTLEIIAGSRRRASCIRGGYPLHVNIIECNDIEALLLAEQENEGRQKTSFIADCRWHLAQYEAIKAGKLQQGDKYTQEQYATSRNTSLSTMQDYLAFAKFPEYIIDAVADQKSFSYRSCNEIRRLLRLHSNGLDLSGVTQFTTAPKLVKHFKPKAQVKPRSESHAMPVNQQNQPPESRADLQHYKKDSISENSFEVNGVENAITIQETIDGTRIYIDKTVNQKLLEEIKSTLMTFTK